ncbi:ring finger-like protein [Thermochaetoides thermophila DSM 1495]|uniref:Ring finger-like protein n=1 Tax=Chaetomium thermophilum (strain DSM 1495 / CBS 144.50 / IMI 039719) TaxID=759272 RepID=G0SA81_CHATD|nr:ring finger-like protein [Thermochaetoides thermophila DSM 1495]EGS19653.1 ring finger-like protein [Thermochaetoides thermophila DSM 1495]
MSTFTAHLNNIAPELLSPSSQPHNHHNPHAVPSPLDTSALYRLLQDQIITLASTAPTQDNRSFLLSLVNLLEEDVAHPPREIEGVSQEFLDGLDRVSKGELKRDAERGEKDVCPICAEKFVDDEYPLVVELPCKGRHRFDLECVGPWLRAKGTCPMCREGMRKKKEKVVVQEDSEEEDMDGLYG